MPIGIGQRIAGKMPLSIRERQPERKKMPLGSIQGAVSKETMPLDIGDGLAGKMPLGIKQW